MKNKNRITLAKFLMFLVPAVGLCPSFGLANAQAADATTSGGDYVNIKKLGVGPSLDIVNSPNLSGAAATSLGSVDARYWANRQFGFDVGAGFGFPQTSPHSEFLGTFRMEGMVALKETKHNVLYADAELMPGFASGSGNNPFFMVFQGGAGLEHAVEEMPSLSIFAEWEPLSLSIYSPGGGASSDVGLGILGSVMNFTTGFRYYF